ncbi:DUF4824 family protein [Ectopseudomonas mendocina]|uniref:DUF4824 family protein n=1 Tax=Ectopseudomonas mendocina TaxID=300 RepID=A0ABZ2RLI4_ECTME
MKLGSQLFLGIGLITAVNVAILSGVYLNRQMPADSVVELSERELAVAFGRGSYDFHTGAQLGLRYRWPTVDGAEQGIRADQLRRLGFDVSPEPASCNSLLLPRFSERKALLVLELNGDSYRAEVERGRQAQVVARQRLKAKPGSKMLARAIETADKDLEYQTMHASRLMVVDSGLDPIELRALYPDRTKYVLLPVKLRPGIRAAAGASGFCVPYASATQLNGAIHLPVGFRAELVRNQTEGSRADVKPFIAKIAFGKRLEPWILSMNRVMR